MASIQKFEDLVCWQRARELANFIFDVTDKSEFRDYDLKRQIRRASISPMSNIAEGFDRGTKAEFIDALFIGKGESGEVRSQLYIAFDRKYIDTSKLQHGLRLTDEVSRLIQSFSEKLKAGGERGMQFKHIPRKDQGKELLRQYAPETYAKLYDEKGYPR